MGKWNLDSEWVVAPRQARSRQTMERVLDAAEELFTSRGFDQTSLQDIAEAAGVSIGAIYCRFADKDAILQAIHDSFSKALTDNFAVAFDRKVWEGKSAATLVRALVERFFNTYRTHPGILCLIERQRLVNPQVNERFKRWNWLTISTFQDLLAERRDEIRHPDYRKGIAVLHHVLHQTLSTTALLEQANASPPFGIENESFKAELVEMALNYLGLDKEDAASAPLPKLENLKNW